MPRKRISSKRKQNDDFNVRRLNETQEFYLKTGCVFKYINDGPLGFGPADPDHVHGIKNFTDDDMSRFKQLWDYHRERILIKKRPEEVFAWRIFEGKEG